MAEEIVNFDPSNFKEGVNGKGHVLVYFWAQWCNPCKQMAPIVEKLAQKYNGKLTVGKLDAGKYSEISSKYSISTVPTFMLFENGIIIDCLIGAVGERGLENMLREHSIRTV